MNQSTLNTSVPPQSRQIVDYGNEFVRWNLGRKVGNVFTPLQVRPLAEDLKKIAPPFVYREYPITALCTKFVHLSINKTKQAVLCLNWTPCGRRVLVGAMSGEFTLWNGMNFNFEMIMQAHDNAVRAISYSHNGDWLITGDQDGIIKVWQPNFNNVNIVNAHGEIIRGLAWSPNDTKFVSGSDDGLVKLWSFATMTTENSLSGHGWDVKDVDWHPSLGLICSGSKDNLLKLWDPRQAKCLATFHGFKNTITKTRFQRIGGQILLAGGSRDNTVRIFDLRQMQSIVVLRGHEADVTSLAWHPIHPEVLTTGTHDGTINHFLLDSHIDETGTMQPVVSIPKAHGWPVWDLSYHPVAHMLCSGSNDKSVRFWSRARPGDADAFADRFYSTSATLEEAEREELERYKKRERERDRNLQASLGNSIPGLSTLQI